MKDLLQQFDQLPRLEPSKLWENKKDALMQQINRSQTNKQLYQNALAIFSILLFINLLVFYNTSQKSDLQKSVSRDVAGEILIYTDSAQF